MLQELQWSFHQRLLHFFKINLLEIIRSSDNNFTMMTKI